jgi:hypothetical protein
MLERRASRPSRQAMTPPCARFAPQWKGKVPLQAVLQAVSSRLPVGMEREILFLQPCLMSIVIENRPRQLLRMFFLTVSAACRLKAFDQIANTQCVSFAMTMTCNRVGASSRFDQNIGPQYPGRNFDRRYLRN